MPQQMDDVELARMLYKQGFRGEGLRTMFAVAKGESGANPLAFNDNAATGDKSYGLGQINMLGPLGPERRAKWGLQSDEDLFNPETNIKAMWDLSKQGTDFRAWSVHPESKGRGGAGTGYEAHLTAAEAAAKQVEVPEATGSMGDGDLAAMYPAFKDYIAWSLRKGYKPRGIEKAITKQLAARRNEYIAMEGVTPAQAAQWSDEDFGGQPAAPENKLVSAAKRLVGQGKPVIEGEGRLAAGLNPIAQDPYAIKSIKDAYGNLATQAKGFYDRPSGGAASDVLGAGAAAAFSPIAPAIQGAMGAFEPELHNVEALGQYAAEGTVLASQEDRLRSVLSDMQSGKKSGRYIPERAELEALFRTPPGSPERKAMIQKYQDKATAYGVLGSETAGAAAFLGGNADVEPERAKALTNTFGETRGAAYGALAGAAGNALDLGSAAGFVQGFRPGLVPPPAAPFKGNLLPPATLKGRPVAAQPQPRPVPPTYKGTVVREPIAGLLPAGPKTDAPPATAVDGITNPNVVRKPAAPPEAPHPTAALEDLLARYFGEEEGAVGNLGPRIKGQRRRAAAQAVPEPVIKEAGVLTDDSALIKKRFVNDRHDARVDARDAAVTPENIAQRKREAAQEFANRGVIERLNDENYGDPLMQNVARAAAEARGERPFPPREPIQSDKALARIDDPFHGDPDMQRLIRNLDLPPTFISRLKRLLSDETGAVNIRGKDIEEGKSLAVQKDTRNFSDQLAATERGTPARDRYVRAVDSVNKTDVTGRQNAAVEFERQNAAALRREDFGSVETYDEVRRRYGNSIPMGPDYGAQSISNRVMQQRFSQARLDRGIEDPSGFSGSKGQEPVYPVKNRFGQEIDHNTVRRRDHQSVKDIQDAADSSSWPGTRMSRRPDDVSARLDPGSQWTHDRRKYEGVEKIGPQDVVKRREPGWRERFLDEKGSINMGPVKKKNTAKAPTKLEDMSPIRRFLNDTTSGGDPNAGPRAVKKQIKAEGIDLAERGAELNTLGKVTKVPRAAARVVGDVLDKATADSFVRYVFGREHGQTKNIKNARRDYRATGEKIARIAANDTNVLKAAKIPVQLEERALRFMKNGDVTKGLGFVRRHADRIEKAGDKKAADAMRAAADTINRQVADMVVGGVALAQRLMKNGEVARPATILKNLGTYWHRTYSKNPTPPQVEAEVKNTLKKARVLVDAKGKAHVYTLGRDSEGVNKAWGVDGDLPDTVKPATYSKLSPAQKADVDRQINTLVDQQLKRKARVAVPKARSGGKVGNSSVLKARKLDDPIMRKLRGEQRNFGVISNSWNKMMRLNMTLDFISNLLDRSPSVFKKGEKLVELENWPILAEHAGRMVPQNVFDAFKDVLGPDGKGVRELGDRFAAVRFINKTMGWFKGKNTMLNLSSHVVQAETNASNAMMMGILHKKTAHKMAWDALEGMRLGTSPTQANPIRTPEGWTLYEAAEKGGFMGGASVGDYVGKIERQMDRSIYNPDANSFPVLGRAMDKVATAVPQAYNVSDRVAKLSAYITARGLDGGEGATMSNWEKPHKMSHDEASEFVDTFLINFQRTSKIIDWIRAFPISQLIVNPFISSKLLGLRVWSQVITKKPLNGAIYLATLGVSYNLYWHIQGKSQEWIDKQREVTAVEWEQFPNRMNIAGPSFYDGAQGYDASRGIPNFEMAKLMKVVPGAPGYDDTESAASNATMALMEMLGEQFLSGPVAAQGFSRWGVKVGPEEDPAAKIFGALAEQALIPGGYRYKMNELIKAGFGRSKRSTGENILGTVQRTVRFDGEMADKKDRVYEGKEIELDKAEERIEYRLDNGDITQKQAEEQFDRLDKKRDALDDMFGKKK